MEDKKSLIIYFSRADENYAVGNLEKGNTEVVAEYIKEKTGADIFKVEPIKPYPKKYAECLEVAKMEKDTKAQIELKEYLTDISKYKIIYIGGPIYFGTYPMPLFTSLLNLDFQGKIVKPFTTHEGSGLGSAVFDLKKILLGAKIEAGLAIQGSKVNLEETKTKIDNWL